MSRKSPSRGKGKPSEGEEKGAKLITSDVLFKKLLWHPTIDQDAVEVGYLDRFKGLKWAALRKWRQGGKDDFDSIPWHRVMQFRYEGIIFWDREARIDLTADVVNGTLTAAPQQTASAAVTPAAAQKPSGRISYPHTKSANLLVFGSEGWNPIALQAADSEADAAAAPAAEHLRIASWNVLFGKYFTDPFTVRCHERYSRIFEALLACKADIVCLQECDLPFTAFLMANDLIRKHFAITDHTAGGKEGSDSIILVAKGCRAVPVGVKHYAFNPNIHAVMVEMSLGGTRLSVAGLHLTSDMAQQAQEKRAKQIAGLKDLVRRSPNAFLVGDYNFGDGPEDDVTDWGGFADAWRDTHPGTAPTPTFDPERNPLAALGSKTGEPRRLDRVMHRTSAAIKLSGMRLLGDAVSEWVQPQDCVAAPPKGQPREDAEGMKGGSPHHLHIAVQGLQCSGKSAFASRLAGACGAAKVSLDAQTGTKAFLSRLSATAKGGASRCVVADAAHLSAEEVSATHACFTSAAGAKPFNVLITVTAPEAVCAERLLARDPTLGEKAGWVVAATRAASAASLAQLPDGLFDLHLEVDGTLPGSAELARVIGVLEKTLGGPALAASAAAAGGASGEAAGSAPPSRGPLLPLLAPSDHHGLCLDIQVSPPSASDSLYDTEIFSGGAVGGAVQREVLPPYSGGYHRSFALAVVVPEWCAEGRISPVMNDHLKSAKAWPAHINMMWPFLEKSAFEANRELIQQAVRESGVSEFRLSLGRFSTRKDRERGRVGMFLAPGDEDGRCIAALRTCIKKAFPNEEERAFDPHLSLGVTGSAEADAVHRQFRDAFASSPDSEGCVIPELVYLGKSDATGKMEVLGRIPFPQSEGEGAGDVSVGLWGQAELGNPHAVTPVTTPRWLLEPHPLGGRKQLDPYMPADQLEGFMLHLTARLVKAKGQKEVLKLLESSPTHVCQKGGRYYIPECYTDEYLHYWGESIRSGVEFYMEEIRGSVFRCYIDLDLQFEGVDTPFDLQGSGWLDGILAFTSGFFERPNLCCVVMECHGPWSSTPRPDVTFKSGFRIYFQDLYVSYEKYKKYIAALGEDFVKHVKGYRGMPEGGLEDIIDMHSVEWERGRLVGTKKRRKNTERVYHFKTVVTFAAEKGSGVRTATGLCGFLQENLDVMLYATTLRMWNTPTFAWVPENCAPPSIQRYWHLVVPEYGATGGFKVLDLLSLRISDFNPDVHQTSSTAVVGLDRPEALSRYPFHPLPCVYEEMFGVPFPSASERPSETLAKQLREALSSYRGTPDKQQLRESEWRRLVTSTSLCL